MSKQVINLGTAPTGVGGDTPRSAFTKSQANFDELYDSMVLKAAKGANSDITSLTGLTTALSVAQGGTGGATQAAARTGLGLKSAAVADILGTVSQTGGVPTGAIIEAGSNGNGSYTKYADGTMICRGISPSSMPTNTAGGSLYYSAAVTFTFPIAFVGGVPAVGASSLTTSNYFCWVACDGVSTMSAVALRVVSPSNTGASYISYIAIGRWFV